MTNLTVRQIQALDVRMFEESAKDLIKHGADWVHTVGDLLLIVAHDFTVWLCELPANEIDLLKAKMIKRVL
ncbi:hypothetical protein PMW_36 [Pseudomonas phage phiPMW]|uniref:Uncharacterized protein n=1 Tax=Pseudomonas phage phiPMW TaxID=1815582 RepID=A0A1S5R169_9CAUD|nr:hypothetical protein FDG97_gp036 [Pseudomonas phage phiPMW]ANA49161.1 hypothetical protein PMW_36 [Pseudomonas phage phiPMW]